MPRLTSEERHAVRGEVLSELAAIADLPNAVERGDYAAARVLRERVEDGLLLMDDLGWEADDPRGMFELTLPPERLVRVVDRLARSAAGALSQEVLNVREESSLIERSALAVRAYAAVLTAIEAPAAPDQPGQ